MMSLAWPLFRVTEQAALAAWPQTGCGDKNKIDGLAVTAMRQALNDVAFRGRVVIGEGEIDHAPMLWIGEEVGKGDGPEVDIAVDPIEGTRMVAMGQSNALAVMAFAPRDSLLHAPDMYMKKLVVNRLAAGAIDLSLPLTDNLRNVAKALGKPLDKLRMVTLDKPRLSAAIEEATQLGVKVFALPDGDVAASVLPSLFVDNDEEIVEYAVKPLLAQSGPLDDIDVALRLIYALGKMDKWLYADITHFSQFWHYLNEQDETPGFADDMTWDFISNVNSITRNAMLYDALKAMTFADFSVWSEARFSGMVKTALTLAVTTTLKELTP